MFRNFLKYKLALSTCSHSWFYLLPSFLALSLSSLPVQIGVEIPAEISRRIIESELLIDLGQLVQILLLQSEIAGQVALDPLRRLALRQHAVAVCDAPGQRDLRAVLVIFLADFDNGGVVDQLAHVLAGVVDGVLVAEGGVLLDVDAFFPVEGGEGGLLEPWMAFDLVRGGDGGRFGEEAGELRFAEVGDADRFRLAAFEGLFHGFPGFEVVCVARLDLVVLSGHEGVAAGEGGGPVHEVEV